jgi:hypothetical protein
MSRPSILRKLLPLTLAAGFLLAALPVHPSAAEQGRAAQGQGPNYVGPPNAGVGGYSLTLRDIWGPAKMPPQPRDFGPHFDFPPQPLNGVPLHDPYPH